MNRIFPLVAAITLAFASCNYSKFPLDEKPVVKADPSLFGIWKAVNDTDKRNFILVQGAADEDRKFMPEDVRNNPDYYYYITYYDRGGVSPHYENFTATLSTVKSDRFLNIAYWTINPDERIRERDEGFLLYRMIHINPSATEITLARVSDPDLEQAKNADVVRKTVTKNLNNPKFYDDTVQLYSIAPGHFSRKDAIKRANQ